MLRKGPIGVVFALMRVLVVLSECISPAAIRPVAPVQRAQFPASGGTFANLELELLQRHVTPPVMARSSTRGQMKVSVKKASTLARIVASIA